MKLHTATMDLDVQELEFTCHISGVQLESFGPITINDTIILEESDLIELPDKFRTPIMEALQKEATRQGNEWINDRASTREHWRSR